MQRHDVQASISYHYAARICVCEFLGMKTFWKLIINIWGEKIVEIVNAIVG